MLSKKYRAFLWEAFLRLAGAFFGALLGLTLGGLVCLLTGDGWEFTEEKWGDPALLMSFIIVFSAVGASFPKSILYVVGKFLENANFSS